jgi:(2Fe-2S) ferredoxin
MKKALAARGLHKDIRANSAGCLDVCEEGPAIVIYPEGVWYVGVREEDVQEIVDEHLVGGRVVERLQRKAPTPKNPASSLHVLT